MNDIQDAFVIAVEPQAQERLEKLAISYKLHATDMAKLCEQLNDPNTDPADVHAPFLEPTVYEAASLKDILCSDDLARCKNVDGDNISKQKVENDAAVVDLDAIEYEHEVQEREREEKAKAAVRNCAHFPKKGEWTEVPSKIQRADSENLGNNVQQRRGSTTVQNRPSSNAPVPFDDKSKRRGLNECRHHVTFEDDLIRPGRARRQSPPSPEVEIFPDLDDGCVIEKVRDGYRFSTKAIIEHHPSTSKTNEANRKNEDSFVHVGLPESNDKNNHRKLEQQKDPYSDRMMMVMAAVDNGPHREMPVDVDTGPHREMPIDVPDSFIARNKTPPRYPPPKHASIMTNGTQQQKPALPVSPPRVVPSATEEQMQRIKMNQEALRKKKEEEDRITQESEFLKSSLRSSKKLKALETTPPVEKIPTPTIVRKPTGTPVLVHKSPAPVRGIANDAFTDDESSRSRNVCLDQVLMYKEEIRKIYDYGEIFCAFQKLHSRTKRAGINTKPLESISRLIQNKNFRTILSIHNKVQLSWPLNNIAKPITGDAKSLITDCLKDLQGSSSLEACKLTEFLTRYEVEELLEAHDIIVKNFYPETDSAKFALENEVPEYDLSADPNIRVIKIDKSNEPLGATVRNEGESVIISRIIKGGAAEKSGLLHEGDEILQVNSLEMRGKSVNEVCDTLTGMSGLITFFIVPNSNTHRYCNNSHHGREMLIYIRALFDYDAEDDIYVPCRELGISFQKGDILIVKSQDDANWWQAFRYGEHDHTLAGLIPSKAFQLQREALKQTFTGVKPVKDRSRKSSTFLCARRNTKKKNRKKSTFHAYQDGGYPLYSSNSDEEFDIEEIPTYEEVIWYYPSTNHKRPIVLIGPPNIGRHELRQRLMEDSDRFAAAVPHTSRGRKEGEIDGQDYHFITRNQFESDILGRKFVEHGEYEKAYYGTSLNAIRSVVIAGKICILNLHAQSLKILRNSDLMPYVVFVAPPSLEKLRQKKIKCGESYKEDELKDIIEKARDMEEKYGHYFDMIIINNDTEQAYRELLHEINKVEREPQWIPAFWIRSGLARPVNTYISMQENVYRRK